MTAHGLRCLAIALGLAVLAAASAALGQEAWHTMTGPERSFTADLPAAPKYTAVQMKTATGSLYTMHQYVFERGDVAYVVQASVYPDDINVSNPKLSLQGGLDSAAKNMEGGKWATVDWVTQQGYTAVDAVGMRAGQAIRSFSALKGRQSVTLTYAGPADTAKSPDVNRFIASFRFGP
jgi:hypothetical protein